MVRFCHIVSFTIIMLSVGITILGAMLVAKERSLCYEALGFGRAIFGLGVLFVVWRLHSVFVVVNLILVLGLTIALALFWGREANSLYSLTDSNWSGVVKCFRNHGFCDGQHHTHVCCAPPDTCVQPFTEPATCAPYKDDPDRLCFLCDACRVAVFTGMRDYSLSLSPAFACFFVIYLLAVTIQALKEWWHGAEAEA